MRGRRLIRTGVPLLVALLLLASGWAPVVAASPASPNSQPSGSQSSTVVSLTFDDGDADQLAAAQLLGQYHLAGTFYIISGAVDTPGYLTRDQLRQVADGGNEIGGHTVSHLDLSQVPTDEARRQVCMSRATLTDWGYQVRSFAYPDGSSTPAVESIVRDCGYTNARAATGLLTTDCADCAPAESMPPADPYAIRTPSQVDTTWTLQTLQQAVLRAQHDGGSWVPLVFHHVCATANGCGSLAISVPLLRQFLAWLADERGNGISVRTVGDVVGAAVRPVGTSSPAPAHGVVNGTLSKLGPSGGVNTTNETATGGGDMPQCWMTGGYGQNVVDWRRVAGRAPGQAGEQLTVTSYTNGDAKLLPQFDLGNCSIPIHQGASYSLNTWYRSTTKTQFDLYYRNPDGRWIFWTSSPYFAPATDWTEAHWQTPPAPAGATGLSFGLALFSLGALTTTDYGIDAGPPPPGPPLFTLVTLPLIGAALILVGVYLLAVRRSVRWQRRRSRRQRRRHIARAARDESPVSSSKR